LENEQRRDDEVDGCHVDAAVDFRRTIREVDVVAVDEVFQQHVQQSCNQQLAGLILYQSAFRNGIAIASSVFTGLSVAANR